MVQDFVQLLGYFIRGAFLLLTSGIMGTLGLCSFNRALRVGGVGFFWISPEA